MTCLAYCVAPVSASMLCPAELVGVVDNVTDSIRANLQLVQLSGTLLQTPCATPSRHSAPSIHTYIYVCICAIYSRAFAISGPMSDRSQSVNSKTIVWFCLFVPQHCKPLHLVPCARLLLAVCNPCVNHPANILTQSSVRSCFIQHGAAFVHVSICECVPICRCKRQERYL